MNRRTVKRAFSMLLVLMLAVFCLPGQCRAEAPEETRLFSTFEELRDLCEQAKDEGGAILLCETTDPVVIAEDLTVYGGTAVVFCQFTVPAGVKMTVSADALVRTRALRIEGELYSSGTLIQDDTSLYPDDGDIDVVARVPGMILNRGEMTLTNVFGTRNVRTYHGQTTMNKTAAYDDLLREFVAEDTPAGTPEPTPEPTPTPTPEPEGWLSDDVYGTLKRIFDWLEIVLPRGAFLLLLIALFSVIKAAMPAKGKRGSAAQRSTAQPRPAQRTAAHRSAPAQFRRQEPTAIVMDYSREDHFERDRRNRIAQLDDWLRNGLIDRQEYRILKKRSEQDGRQP